MVYVGMPEEGLDNISSQALSGNAAALGSSHIGNKIEAIQMLNLAAEKDVKPWINVLPMKEAATAIKAVKDSSVRYRTILVQVSDCLWRTSRTRLMMYQDIETKA